MYFPAAQRTFFLAGQERRIKYTLAFRTQDLLRRWGEFSGEAVTELLQEMLDQAASGNIVTERIAPAGKQ